MKTNKYIKIDTELELSLYKFIENSSKPTERKRAMAILMNSNRQSVLEIAKKIEMNPDTVYDWLIKFTNDGIQGIKNKPIPGRPKKLKMANRALIKEVFLKST